MYCKQSIDIPITISPHQELTARCGMIYLFPLVVIPLILSAPVKIVGELFRAFAEIMQHADQPCSRR